MVVSLSNLSYSVAECYTLTDSVLILFVALLILVACLVVHTANVHLRLVARRLVSWASPLVLQIRLTVPVADGLIVLVVAIVVDFFVIVLLVLVLSLRLRVFLV